MAQDSQDTSPEGKDPEARLVALEGTLEQVLGRLQSLDRRLASLDGVLATINRGIGATEARLAALEVPRRGWSFFHRLRSRLPSFKVRRRPPLVLSEDDAASEGVAPYTVRGRPPLVPNVAKRPRDPANGPPRVVIVTAFELTDKRLEKVLDTVESYASRRHVAPVILTDCPHFEIFRRRGLAFEYLPPVASRSRFAGDLPWDIYLGRRLALLRAKWRPIGIISFGNRGPVGGSSALAVLSTKQEIAA